MRRDSKRASGRTTSREKGNGRTSIRDKIRSQFRRLIKKEQCYIVEPSNEPEGNKDYVVIYESETEKGFGCGRVFKGTEKECNKLAKELNKSKGELK